MPSQAGWLGTRRGLNDTLQLAIRGGERTVIPIECIKEAERGRRVLVVTDCKLTASVFVGDHGALYIRNFRLSGLKSVAVDMVYLVGDVPEDVARLAIMKCSGSIIGQVRRV